MSLNKCCWVLLATVLCAALPLFAQAPAEPETVPPQEVVQAPPVEPVADAAATAPAEAPEAPKDVTPVTFYVSPAGNDVWSGTLPEPNGDGSDGPVATLNAARDAVRKLRNDRPEFAGAVTVMLREGVYAIKEPFTLSAVDSGTHDAPVTYTAYAGERPVISGGRAITGWQQEGQFWVADLPEVRDTDLRFGSLWVNGERRSQARTPNDGFFTTAGKAPPVENPTTGEMIMQSNTSFYYTPGDLKRWEDLDEAVVVVLHAWETSMHHITSLDEEKNIVTFRNASVWPFENWGPRQRYYVLNTFEGLDVPGEWCLNRKSGKLYYYPKEGETLDAVQVVAPMTQLLVQFDGSPTTNQFVDYVRLDGLSFQHVDYSVGSEGYAEAGFASGVPAAIQTRGARFCDIVNCEMVHMDTYAVWLRAGSIANRVARNHMHDLGAGGVRVGERQRSNPVLDVSHNLVDNNFIHDGGHMYRSGVGIWIGQSFLNRISHNDICDLANSGVTVGFAWDVDAGFSYDNLVEYNYIHHIGRGEFSNMAGIYVLGGSGRSVLRNNIIHDVIPYQYGGWGIHLDEGSSNMVIENNLIYNTISGGFDQFYGNLNHVRNNIFAFSRQSQISLSSTRETTPTPVIFERNIVVVDNGVLFGALWEEAASWQDFNCYFDTSGTVIDFGGSDFANWQSTGRDARSILADPGFVDVANFDFSLRPDSPALALGFKPLDLDTVGLYGAPEWVQAPHAFERAHYAFPESMAARAVSEDFESIPTGAMPADAIIFGTDGKASVAITEETAASGTKSLKITDTAGPQQAWQPELCFTPSLLDGVAVGSFDVRMEVGAILQCDWRSDWTTRRVGPRLKVAQGALFAGQEEQKLMDLPTGEWVHIEIECQIGIAAVIPNTYKVSVTVPGEETQHFDGLPCIYPMFRSVDRIWFLSSAVEDTVFFLDNIKLDRR